MLPQVIHFKYSSVYMGGLIPDTEKKWIIWCPAWVLHGVRSSSSIRETSLGHVFHPGQVLYEDLLI